MEYLVILFILLLLLIRTIVMFNRDVTRCTGMCQQGRNCTCKNQ